VRICTGDVCVRSRSSPGFEVVVVGLDLRALGHGEPEAREDLDDLVFDALERMDCAEWRPAPGEREIGT